MSLLPISCGSKNLVADIADTTASVSSAVPELKPELKLEPASYKVFVEMFVAIDAKKEDALDQKLANIEVLAERAIKELTNVLQSSAVNNQATVSDKDVEVMDKIDDVKGKYSQLLQSILKIRSTQNPFTSYDLLSKYVHKTFQDFIIKILMLTEDLGQLQREANFSCAGMSSEEKQAMNDQYRLLKSEHTDLTDEYENIIKTLEGLYPGSMKDDYFEKKEKDDDFESLIELTSDNKTKISRYMRMNSDQLSSILRKLTDKNIWSTPNQPPEEVRYWLPEQVLYWPWKLFA